VRTLPEAQAHARANNIDQYWRIHYSNHKEDAGGWLAVNHPRHRFAFTQSDAEAMMLVELRGKRTVTAEVLRTAEVSNSPNAR